MTTPHQSAPDGAVTIGGNAWNFGQLIDEKRGREQFEIEPPSNLAEALELLPVVMGRLPNDALKPWQKWLNLTDEDRLNGTVLEQFIANLQTSPLAQVITDVQDTIDGMIRGLVGWTETGYTPVQLQQIAREVAVAVSDLQSVVSQLTNANGYSGTARSVDFSRAADSPSLGPDWAQTYFSGSGSGTLGIGGGRAKWLGSASERWCSARYTAAETKSDFQKIGAVFSSKPSWGVFGGSRSINRIMGRVSVSGLTFVAVDFNAEGFILGAQVGGAWTNFASVGHEFQPGAVYWLECGTTGGANVFRVWKGNTILVTYTDYGVSSIGSDFRSVGYGVKAFSDSMRPAECASFAFFDNTPTALRGSGWRLCRTSTVKEDQSAGQNLFPSSWFDTIDRYTDDILYDPVNNKVTVAATGWYQINVVQFGNSPIIVGGGAAAALLLVNGAVAQQGAPVAQTPSTGSHGFSATFNVYLIEGDFVQPGYWASWNALDLLEADASGAKTYWSGVYLGTSKKMPVAS